ncbi:phospholipase/carboxylesterase family protein [Xylariaceae sp. FL0804]|nr:phospholipase/carboxylesterase family protein [Xylariaceae sp. FL0804]
MVLRCVTLPAHNQHTHTVIFLHGRGSSARDFSDELFEEYDDHGHTLQHIFPTVKWVFPEAGSRYSARFEDHFPQWFDIWSLDDPDERRELQTDGLRQNTAELIALVRAEAVRVGGLDRVVLAGISQGCALAIHALLNYPSAAAESPSSSSSPDDEATRRLGAFVGLSSWMSLGEASVPDCRAALGLADLDADPGDEQQQLPPPPPPPSDHVYRNTPVFLSHSADDPTVPAAQGRRLRDILNAYGMRVTWREYANAEHWISGQQGVANIVAFLRSHGLSGERAA